MRVNRRYEEMYGYGPGELIGQSVSPIYPSAQAFCEAASIYQALARPDHAPRRAAPAQGREHVLEPRRRSRARSDNPHKGSVWTVEDVTAERRAEEELQRVMAEQQAPRQRDRRHCVQPRAQGRALQPSLRGDVRLWLRRGDRSVLARDLLHRCRIRRARRRVRRARPRRHARARAMAAPPGRLGVLVSHVRPRGRGRRRRQGLCLADGRRQRAPARRSGARAPGARAGRGAAERRHRHHLRPGPAHRAREPPLRRALWLRRGRAHRPFHALHVRNRRGVRGGRRACSERCGAARRCTSSGATCARRRAHLVLDLRTRGTAGRPGAGLGLALR